MPPVTARKGYDVAAGSNLLRLALALGFSAWAPGLERTIDEAMALKLIDEALPAVGEVRASVQIGPWRYYWAPEFYTFQAWRAGEGGVLLTYYFAVNPWTGDVWDAMACKRITTREVQKDQEAIWARSGIPSEAREALRERSPADCSNYVGRGDRDKK